VPLKLGAYTACPHDRPLAKAVEVLKANFRRGEARDSRCFTIRPQVSARHGYSTNRHSPVMAAHLAGRQVVRREGRDRRGRAQT